MGSPYSSRSSFAARAAYFGDRMCAFCDHRNPADAKFCNDCAAPLHLKPCKQCDAVNDLAAASCYKCGVAYPVSCNAPEATSGFRAADSPGGWQQPDDAQAMRAPSRLRRLGPSLAAAIATILIVWAYDAYRVNVATPGAIGVGSEPVGKAESNAIAAATAVPGVVASTPAEPEKTVVLQRFIPATNAEAPKRPSARQRPGPIPVTKRAGAQQRRLPVRQAAVRTTPPSTHSLRRPRVDARMAQASKGSGLNPRQAMQVSLASCGGDLIACIVRDQHLRRRFCEGHWGQTLDCAGGVANDHGQ